MADNGSSYKFYFTQNESIENGHGCPTGPYFHKRHKKDKGMFKNFSSFEIQHFSLLQYTCFTTLSEKG